MDEFNSFVVDNGLLTGISPSANVGSNSVPFVQPQPELSVPALTTISGNSSSFSSSSSSSSFVNDQGAGASSSAISTSPDGTVSDSATVFTPGATSSSANASAIASSTEPGSAIATVDTSESGDVFAIAPSTLDQSFVIVNITPDIEFGLIDIQSIEQLLLTVNFTPDVEFEFAPIEFSDRVDVFYAVSSTVNLFSSLDMLVPQASSSILVKDFNIDVSLLQQESSQSAFIVSDMVGLFDSIVFDSIVFDPVSLEFSLELKFSRVPVTAAD